MNRAPRVFISYAHDSDLHKQLVYEFALFLRANGVEADLDQFHLDERKDWSVLLPERMLVWADYVVVIASAAYKRVGDGWGAAPDDHPGVQSEAAYLRDHIYADQQGWTSKILPVVLPGRSVDELPTFVHPHVKDHFIVESFTIGGATDILRALHADSQSLPTLGPPPKLPGSIRQGWRRSRTGSMVVGIEQAAVSLARQVHAQAEAKGRQGRVQSRTLPVRWEVTPRAWAATAGLTWTSLTVIEPKGLAGTFEDIALKFMQVYPHHRLVILGESGAGKSALAHRLERDLVRNRAANGPVPVVFDARTWNPDRHELADWLARELLNRFVGLAGRIHLVDGQRPTLARALVDSGSIMPIIDGLDAVGSKLRQDAIRELDSHSTALVVTGQPEPYFEAITSLGHGLSGSAVVELLPLSHTELVENLELLGDAGWQRMRECVSDDSQGPLSQALRTPLMIWLLRTKYRAAAADAGELCDQTRFPDRAAIENQLLGGFVHAAYDDRGPRIVRRQTDGLWLLEDIDRWHCFLAQHMQREGGAELCWWRLHRTMPLVAPLLDMTVAVLFMYGIGFLVDLVPLAVGCGIALGLLVAIPRGRKVLKIPSDVPPNAFKPQRARVWWTLRVVTRDLVRAFLRIIVPSFVGLVLLDLEELGIGFTIAGAIVALAAIVQIPFELGRKLPPPNPEAEVVSPFMLPEAPTPRSVLRADRKGALFLAITIFMMFATLLLVAPPRYAFIPGASLGLALALRTAYARFIATRILLVSFRRLPARLMLFLDDAVDRGVLRHVGAAYQYSHDRLLEHLSAQARR